MDVNKLLDKAKEVRSMRTDADLAKALGVSKQAMSGWRTGARLPDAVACATLAGLTGEPLAKVLGIVGEARAISREEKSVWRKLAASAVALAMLLGAITLPGVGMRDAHAQVQAQKTALHSANNRHYAKYRQDFPDADWRCSPMAAVGNNCHSSFRAAFDRRHR